MANRFRRELGLVVAWLVFPLVPVILEDLYYQTCNLTLVGSGRAGPEPRDWSWLTWVIMLGPLLGYGFLAGATTDLPDDPATPRRGLRRLLARRSVWLAIGPWSGLVFWVGVYFGLMFLANLLPATSKLPVHLPESWKGTWIESTLWWVLGVFVVGTLSYGWLRPAWAALRRAARNGRWRTSLYRGLIMAMAFVGSLFGSFWAATACMRSYFFDPRLVPLVAVAVGLALMSGCGGTITYGELRRRELFHAMLVAWVLGLALMWRWWSRARGRPPAC